MSQERSKSATLRANRGKPGGHWEREERLQRLVLGLLGLVVLVAILILVVPYLKRNVWDPNQSLAKVGSQTITQADYDKYSKLQSLYLTSTQYLKPVFDAYRNNPSQVRSGIQNQVSQTSATQSGVNSTTLETMVQNAILLQSADKLGIPLSDDKINDYLIKHLGASSNAPAAATPPTAPTAVSTPSKPGKGSVAPAATPAPLPPSDKQIQGFFDLLKSTIGVSREDYIRLVVGPDYIRQQYTEKNVPDALPQVHVRHILVSKKSEADMIMKKLRNGAKFEVLAKQYSTDTSNKTKGGDLGWAPKGIYVAPFEKAAFGLDKVGQIAGPVKSKFGYHIIQLLGKDNHRKLTSAQKQQLGYSKLSKFIAQQRKQLKKQGQLEVKVPATPTP